MISKSGKLIFGTLSKLFLFNSLRNISQHIFSYISNFLFSKKTQTVIKDDNYWANFYFQRAQRFRYADGVRKDIEYAIKLYRLSANLGHLESQVSLSYLLLLNNYTPEHKQEAFKWALKASEHNHPAALFNLGIMYKNGFGTTVNYTKAFGAIERSISNGFYNIENSGEAYFQLGLMYKQGLGTKINLEKAIEWLTKAVGANYSKASFVLQDIHLFNSKANKNSQDETITSNNYTQNKQSKKNTKKNADTDNRSENPVIRLVSCPSCNHSLTLPRIIPKAVIRCTKCHFTFRIKKDSYGNYQIINLIENPDKEQKIPKSKHEARDVLSILTHDSSTQIKRAYKIKMRDYHPDRVNNLGIKLKRLAELESKRINAAYDILKAT